MIDVKHDITPGDLVRRIERLWELSAEKILAIEAEFDRSKGAPVFTAAGRYTTRGWTEWTEGFQFGSSILQFDATGDERFLDVGRDRTVERMAPHVTHFGVHDHGFNNVSTYGNLLRLMNEGRIDEDIWERRFYEMALKASSAVQARRWSATHDGDGYIYSFNGPQSLFADTMRSLRVLALGHQLGHVLKDENDVTIQLLDRLVQHARTTARYVMYYGEERDAYDVRGRVVHEALFNTNDGNFRAPSTQQGYSPFSTWTRGLAWAMCGYAEQLEFLTAVTDEELFNSGGRAEIVAMMERAARAACDFYIENTPSCGVPYWDTGAPGLSRMDAYLDRPADPYNDFEPVDSSAAAIAAQGLLRLGAYLKAETKEPEAASNYRQAGLSVLNTLLNEPYLSTDVTHHGLILHSIYHHPNGWDYVPPGSVIPHGEATMWGDYHARELALYVQRRAHHKPYLKFYLD